MALLNDDEWSQWSDREIARRCAVSDYLVRDIRKSLTAISRSDEGEQPRIYTTKHGTTATMNTANIGKRNKPGFVPPRQSHESIDSMVLNMAVIQNAICPTGPTHHLLSDSMIELSNTPFTNQ